MPVAKAYRPNSIEQAWINLASDVLLMAIEDVRQDHDHFKKWKAKEWLLSPAAKLFFDTLDVELNVKEWVMEDCPTLDQR